MELVRCFVCFSEIYEANQLIAALFVYIDIQKIVFYFMKASLKVVCFERRERCKQLYMGSIRDEDGSLLMDGGEAIERWKQNFNGHLNGQNNKAFNAVFRIYTNVSISIGPFEA